ncbi:MAG: hypothetical protein A2309_06755 [Bacteroidetes bacterium RIFOXYB2_FULL_35_7]|nr:MAG: hypothetical protein A2X01_04110 [Bacteroidetes bacterium GWF2_35_48]OFY94888.1 MAG: hypothetical protein A2309_06755 [Bacteroidetes bacterium RIFOXYB2_FULL_35_7]
MKGKLKKVDLEAIKGGIKNTSVVFQTSQNLVAAPAVCLLGCKPGCKPGCEPGCISGGSCIIL